MVLSVPDPEHGDKYRCFRDRACDEVIDRLAAIDRARELIDPDDPEGAAASDRLRQWARWIAEAHNYGLRRDDAP